MTKENKSVRQDKSVLHKSVWYDKFILLLEFLGVKRHFFVACCAVLLLFYHLARQGQKFTKWHKISKT